MPRYVSVLAVLALAACEPIEIEPIPHGAMLKEGRYDMVIKEVVASACDDGFDSGAAAGQVVDAELVRGEDGVTFRFAGWALHGTMEPGNLHVQGVVEAEPVPMPEEEEPEVIDVGEGEDGDGEDGDAEEGGREPVEHSGEGRPPEDAAPAEPRASALLDAAILEPELAEGTLFVSVPGCDVELEVVIGRGRGDVPTEPPVDEPHDDEPRDDEPGEVVHEEDEGPPPA